MRENARWKGSLGGCVLILGGLACTPSKSTVVQATEQGATATPPLKTAGSDHSNTPEPAAVAPAVLPVPHPHADTEDGLVYAAIGCPADKITVRGCEVCPRGPLWQDAEEPHDVQIVLTRGERYSAAPGEHVMAVFSSCQDVAGQEITDYVHLVRGDDSKWVVQSIASLDDITQCDVINGPDGFKRHLCESMGGRMGLYSLNCFALIWSKTVPRDDVKVDSPLSTHLASGVFATACQQNYVVSDSVKKSVKDVDGVSLLTLILTHKEGPYDGALSECADGDFEGPLSPKRKAMSSSRTLNYRPTLDGYVETSGQSGRIPISKGYQELVQE